MGANSVTEGIGLFAAANINQSYHDPEVFIDYRTDASIIKE